MLQWSCPRINGTIPPCIWAPTGVYSQLINVVPYNTYSKPVRTDVQLCSCSGLRVRSCLLSSPSLRDGRIRQITPINDDMFMLPTRFHLPPAAIPSTRQRNKYSCKLKAAEWVQVHPFNSIQTIQSICSQLIPSLHIGSVTYWDVFLRNLYSRSPKATLRDSPSFFLSNGIHTSNHSSKRQDLATDTSTRLFMTTLLGRRSPINAHHRV